MLEFLVILMGAMPFLVGILAIRRMKKGNDAGTDDPPPPPDPQPPMPMLPSSPESRRSQMPVRPAAGRDAVRHMQARAPQWKHRVHCEED